MATLEHVRDDNRDHYRLRAIIDRRRKTIGLGNFDESDANIAKDHIEHVIGQRRRNRPTNAKTSAWLDTIPDEIHDRLAELDLVEPRTRCELPRTIIAYMRAYIVSRDDWKKPENYVQAVDKLETFLRGDAPLASLSKGDAVRWHRWLTSDKGAKLSPNTAGQNIKRCRQIMRQAVDDGLVEVNPFLGIKLDLRSDQAKRYFVDATDTVAILDACPDQEWRVIVALGRYGGLRSPSEVLGLKWSDINWERDRFLVTAPKTERYGKGERVVPLFDGLREELTALFAQAAPGVKCAADGPVVARYRSSEANLRTTFTKIVKRAGVKPFPKPFMNLRASARTEKERSGRFANHVLNDWFGHSGDIAETYYLQTTEDDFKEAAKPSGVLDLSLEGQLEGQSLREQGASLSRTKTKKPRENGVSMAAEGARKARKYTPEDSNL
jgi:integrase